MNGRTWAKVAAAIVVIGSGAVLLRGHAQVGRAQPQPMTSVVVAIRDLPPLAAIEPGDVAVHQVPAGSLSGALHRPPYGMAAKVPLVAGQVIMRNDLGVPVPKGDALVGVKTTLAQSSGMARPGDQVEVISVATGGTHHTKATVLGTATLVALEGGDGAPAVSGSATKSGTAVQTNGAQAPQVPAAATLLVPQAMAPSLAKADAHGKIYLAVIP